jgi:APA family basic amino acid/polyamine antiporter
LSLKRELGLRDLTLFIIACVVGTRWVASAAHAGPGSLLLWALAALLLLIPLSIAVATLTVKHPEAGGLYRWSHADFGPWHGFLAFWSYWFATAFWFPSAAMFYASIALTPIGLSENRVWLLAVALGMIWIAMATNIVGVSIGKWTENLGAIASWILAALLVAAATLVWSHSGSATHFRLLPSFNWETISVWSTIAFAMTGIESAGFMAAEIRDPARDMPRAAWISAVFVTIFYIASTAALLIILQPGAISELNGVVEAANRAGNTFGVATVLLILAIAVGQFGGLGSSVSRMPFAAGVDHLLPPAFARLHPRWNTPVFSMIVFGVLASLLLVLAQVGDTMRAAYQALVSLMVITGFLPFLYLFGSAWKAGKRWTAAFGQAMTVLAIICSIAPTASISNVWLFELKVTGGTAFVIVAAWLFYRAKTTKQHLQPASVPQREPV